MNAEWHQSWLSTKILSRYDNEYPSFLTPHWTQVTSKKYGSLPVVAVVVGSWVWVVDCELPNQNHIQLLCFWVAAWLFECTVEATRLIMKILFSESHLPSIKPLLSVLYRVSLFIIEWGLKGWSWGYFYLSRLLPSHRISGQHQEGRLGHEFNALNLLLKSPQIVSGVYSSSKLTVLLLMTSFYHHLEAFNAA